MLCNVGFLFNAVGSRESGVGSRSSGVGSRSSGVRSQEIIFIYSPHSPIPNSHFPIHNS
ncbi:MAG: AraC family transcriptional regulator [Microcystis aeruginosa Ma_QC_C_20070703_M131]|uniref:AraC family transcriptional regulator n=1 Tax=Microcystis aeruginosa Ma_QC_C_20070703_M131 TaxID=2486263 RepID=A0A551Y007_MICAE|nr:MAG: AraC family transcriptional regulator [Microcystis aeruginosa Ma_QC_C_20070703_M131]